VGIATEAGEEPYRSFDLAFVQGLEWTPEMEAEAAGIQNEMDILGSDVKWFRPEALHTALTKPHRKTFNSSRIEPIRNEARVGRNEACPCGSGKKYKQCCLRRI
jgi:uncharacterized protein YecA (UPF0149 family)